MVYSFIFAALESHGLIPQRLLEVVAAYLITLMGEAHKHSLTHAAKTAGGSVARYSRLLSEHHDLAVTVLSRQARRALKKISKSRVPLVPGAPWTIALIIDATLHPRSSRHVQNAQKLNHGEGFIVGHQWTNIVLVIGNRTIPLPPIPFWTKAERRRRKLDPFTEHDLVTIRIAELNLAELVGSYLPKEVVVLMDSGYDDSAIVREILGKGFDAVWATKTNRGVLTNTAYERGERRTRRIDVTFRAMRKQAPWQTIRPKAKSKKHRRRYRARGLIGRVKGVARDLKLVCSQKSGRTKGRRYIACSKATASIAQVVLAYELRWRVESFHRTVKSRLGMTEAGLSSFDAISAHVHWVYCAYILLEDLELKGVVCIEDKQRMVAKELAAAPFREAIGKIINSRTQFGGQEAAKRIARAALQDGDAA